MRRLAGLALAFLLLGSAHAVPVTWGLPAAISGGGFTPVTHTYTSGTAATETIPSGAGHLVIEDCGAGGAGGSGSGNFGSGGGSGGYVTKTYTIAVGDYGKTLTYTVGAAGVGFNNSNGTNGSASTVVNNTFTTAVNFSAGGGFGGDTSGVGPGNGGAASGGTTNTAGNAGSLAIGGSSVVGVHCSSGVGGHGRESPQAGDNGGGATIVFAYT